MDETSEPRGSNAARIVALVAAAFFAIAWLSLLGGDARVADVVFDRFMRGVGWLAGGLAVMALHFAFRRS